VNADGLDDLVAVSQATSSPSTLDVLLAYRDGGFSNGSLFPIVGPIFATESVALGDFNQDGRPDAVTATCSSGQSMWTGLMLGTEDGGFSLATVLDAGTYQGNRQILSGDFDNDGRLDFVMDAASLAVFMNAGDGGFVSTPALVGGGIQAGWGSVTRMTAADFNGDGCVDLAATSLGSNVTTWLSECDGGFGPAINSSCGYECAVLTAGDLNGDGLLDLATGGWAGQASVSILLGNGDGTFVLQPGNYPVGFQPLRILAGAFSHEDRIDLVVSSAGSPFLSVLVGEGDGGFEAPTALSTGRWGPPENLAKGDFNGDGRLDLVAAESGGFLVYFGK